MHRICNSLFPNVSHCPTEKERVRPLESTNVIYPT